MSAWDAVHLAKLAIVLVFLAPPILAVLRGAILPTILATILSAIGLAAILLSASADLNYLASMASLSTAEFQPPSALQLERLGVSLTILGSAIWLGAMIAALAGHLDRHR